MSRESYSIFIDEVKPTPAFDVYNFTALIIKSSVYERYKVDFNSIKDNALKRLGGRQVNIHFSPLIGRRQHTDFETLTYFEEEAFWIDMYNLLISTDYNILSGLVHNNRYKHCYSHNRVDLEVLAFKLLLQNCARFLLIKNGRAELMIEASNDDNKIEEEYYRNRMMGSKYITAQGYTNVFRSIEFANKEKLNEGLQTVDLFANPISRMVSGAGQFPVERFSGCGDYLTLLRSKIFDGGVGEQFEFGVRKIFC